MKIGFEAQRIFRAHKHGMDFVALELLKALKRLETSHEFILYVNEGDDVCFEESENFTIKIKSASYPVWEQQWLPKEAEKDGVDLLHCTGNTMPLFCKVPVVVTLHDVIYLEKNPLFAKGYTPYQRFGNVYRRLVVKNTLENAAQVLTVSSYEIDNILRFFPKIGPKLQVLYNGVGKHFQKINDQDHLNAIAAKYKLPEKFIMFLGNTDPKKNTANTLEAFGLFSKKQGFSHKLVVGDINPDEVKKMLQDRNMADVFEHIHFTGYIKNAELPAIINQAAVFLYPSNRESFGIPVIEAMACGTPVVTSNVTSMPEVAGDAGVLVNPKDPQDIANGIAKLFENPELKSQLIEKGYLQAQKFDWDESAKKLIQIYETIVSNKK